MRNGYAVPDARTEDLLARQKGGENRLARGAGDRGPGPEAWQARKATDGGDRQCEPEVLDVEAESTMGIRMSSHDGFPGSKRS